MRECKKDDAMKSAVSNMLASEKAVLIFDSRRRNCGLDLDAKQGLGANG
jgi:hypothetical protein